MKQPPKISKHLTDKDVAKLYLYLLQQAAVGQRRKEHDEAVRESRERREPRLIMGLDGNEKVVGWRPPGFEKARCGAKTRAGAPCKAPAVPGKKRCRMHGGLSTGNRARASSAKA